MKRSCFTLLCLGITALLLAQKPNKPMPGSKLEEAVTPYWRTFGNSRLDPSRYFIGTTDARGFSIRTSNRERLRITHNGLVGIGTSKPGARLEVAGGDAMINRLTIGRGGDPFDSSNTAIGFKALMHNVRRDLVYFTNNNTAVGAFALKENTIGVENTAVGVGALEATSEGFENTALGYRALNENTTGGNNTAVGVDAMRLSKGGHENTAVGQYALAGNAVGNWNTATGFNALRSNGSGIYNTALGSYSMEGCNGCKFNTAVGTFSGMERGAANTAVGYSAGQGDSMSNSTFVGYFAFGQQGISNATAIGNEAFVPASNQVVIGNANVTSIGGFANWTNISDGRYKKNVKEDVPGLAFINQLRPVTYTLDLDGIEKVRETALPSANVSPATRRPHSTERKGQPGSARTTAPRPPATPEHIMGKDAKAAVVYTGFVAQEVESAAKVLNYDFSGVDKPKDKSGFYGLRYSDFVVPLVQAVKELSEKTNEVDRLKSEVDAMNKRIERLEELLAVKNDVASSKGFLQQNTPNPFFTSTTIPYYVPVASTSAYILITDMKGQWIKKVTIGNRGSGVVTFNSAMLAAGNYNCALWIDGKQVETKQLVLSR